MNSISTRQIYASSGLEYGLEPSLDSVQLRHHMKNVMQTVIIHLVDIQADADAGVCARLDTLISRIIKSSEVSDLLYQDADHPGAFRMTLTRYCQSVAMIHSRPGQKFSVIVNCIGDAPSAQMQQTVLRAAHELVGNAVKNGNIRYKAGETTQIQVRCRISPLGSVTLTVRDNGPGFPDSISAFPDRGLGIVARLTAAAGGKFARRNQRGGVVRLSLP